MDANAMHLAAYRRALQAKGRSPRTIQNYEEALLQLAAHSGDRDLIELEQADIEDYLTWVSTLPGRRRAGHLPGHISTTAGVRFRALRAFYNWAEAEERLEGRSPMRRMSEPAATDAPPPIVPDDDIRRLLKACQGKDFEARRDTAMIRLFCEAGSPRVSEMAGLLVDESLDMRRDMIRVIGKGNKTREIPFGPKTGQALDRYLPVRAKHRLGKRPELWLGARGQALTSSGITQMLRRRCAEAGIAYIHPHRLRHTAAHAWFDNGGSTEDAMWLFGWSSPEMPAVYGRSAQADRAQRAAKRSTIADRF